MVDLNDRLAALEARLMRLEALVGKIDERLDDPAPPFEQMQASIQAWVTAYVSMRLQQLVPETCVHPESVDGVAATEGPVLPGTRIRCTDEVLHRLGRIPIPFVRQMVTQKVVETARTENVPQPSAG